MRFALGLAWLLASTLAWGDAESSPDDLVQAEKPEYHKCHGDMLGHDKAGSELPVCHHGNGTYAQYKSVLHVLRGTDWFPFTRYSTLVGEVRVVCREEGAGLPSRIVYPARGERGRARIELSCAVSPAQAKKLMARAAKVFDAAMSAKTRDKLPKLARDVVLGSGQPLVNGRPFSFKLGGFEVLAGLEPEHERTDEELSSPDPVVRVRALIRARDRLDDEEWYTKMRATLDKLGKDKLAELVEEGFDSPDARVRLWALDQVASVPETRRDAIVTRALSDSDAQVRSRVIPYVAKLGEPYVGRALRDSDRAVRMFAFDTVIGQLFDTHQDVRARRYLEEGSGDQDSGIREFAEGKLRVLHEQDEYIRQGKPGWEDGQPAREIASPRK